MTSSASGLARRGTVALSLALGLALAAVTAACAQAAPADAAVAAAVAERWGADPARVRLAWGAGRGPEAGTPFRLTGDGRDGWFGVIVEPAGAPPRALRLRAGLADTIPVAARALARGETLDDGAIRGEAAVRWGPPAPGVWPAAGWEVKRALLPGDRLAPPAVMPPPVVRAGDDVRVTWRRGGVRIELAGTALNAAALGEPVTVRLAGQTGQRGGIAAGPGEVRLGT